MNRNNASLNRKPKKRKHKKLSALNKNNVKIIHSVPFFNIYFSLMAALNKLFKILN